MSDQPDLFEVGERLPVPFANVDKRGNVKIPRTLCVPAALGTGPKGETCRTCKHKARQEATGGHYLKCALMRKVWTRGKGTDIKASWPACGRWEARDDGMP